MLQGDRFCRARAHAPANHTARACAIESHGARSPGGAGGRITPAGAATRGRALDARGRGRRASERLDWGACRLRCSGMLLLARGAARAHSPDARAGALGKCTADLDLFRLGSNCYRGAPVRAGQRARASERASVARTGRVGVSARRRRRQASRGERAYGRQTGLVERRGG